jgi:hypothetical protein
MPGAFLVMLLFVKMFLPFLFTSAVVEGRILFATTISPHFSSSLIRRGKASG